jgi:DNA polymerase-3 subunit delta'
VRFSEILHQPRAISILRRALRSGRTHHAYLFDGPEGVGKALTARALAARLLCETEGLKPDDDACGRCPSCHLLAVDTHPDFHLVHRGLHKLHPERKVRRSKGLFLVVDLIRHFVIEPAGMKPSQGRRRVFVILDAERMNEEAQNALLKTLEEPPGEAVLILVSSSAFRLLPTIRSRCQRIPFDLLPPAFIADVLRERFDTPAEDARALARLCDGRLGVAVGWRETGLLALLEPVAALSIAQLGDPEAFAKGAIQLAADLAKRSSAAAPSDEADEPDDEDDDESGEGDDGGESSKSVSTDALRSALRLILMLIATLHRDALLIQNGAAGLLAGRWPETVIVGLAKQRATAQLHAAVAAAAETERMIDRNVAPQLALERLAVAMLGELPVVG